MTVDELNSYKIDTIKDLPHVVVESGDKTPYVELDRSRGLLRFEGRSIPENAQQFYRLILSWIEHYLQNPQPETTLHLNLEYFNTSSSKILLDIMMRLKKLSDRGIQTRVVWMYHEEDEEMHEAGDDYASLIEVPFEIIPYH